MWIYPVVGPEEDPRQTKGISLVLLSHSGVLGTTTRLNAKAEHLLMGKDTATLVVKARHPLEMINIHSVTKYVTISAFHVTAASTISTITHTGDKNLVYVGTSSFKCAFLIQSSMTFFHTHRISMEDEACHDEVELGGSTTPRVLSAHMKWLSSNRKCLALILSLFP